MATLSDRGGSRCAAKARRTCSGSAARDPSSNSSERGRFGCYSSLATLSFGGGGVVMVVVERQEIHGCRIMDGQPTQFGSENLKAPKLHYGITHDSFVGRPHLFSPAPPVLPRLAAPASPAAGGGQHPQKKIPSTMR